MISSTQIADGRARTGRPKLRLINPRSPLTTITMPEIIQKMTFSRRHVHAAEPGDLRPIGADAGWDVEIVDENLTDGLHAARADVDAVGIGAMTTQARRAYEIGDAYLALNVPVILGGIHPSAPATGGPGPRHRRLQGRRRGDPSPRPERPAKTRDGP